MSETKIHDAPKALPKGYSRKTFGEKLGRLRIIDQIPTIELRVKAMIIEGWNENEIAARCQVSRVRVTRLRNVLGDPVNKLNAVKYLEEFIAANTKIRYTLDMEKAGEILDLLSSWDSKAVSRLVEDLRSGKLAQHYAAAAEPVPTETTADRSSPPDGQLYAARPDRRETAPQFIERVYGGAGWLTGAFTRADLRKVDPQAVAGLINWERTNGRASVNLPTIKERNDRRLEAPTDGVGKLERMERQRLAATRRYKSRQSTN